MYARCASRQEERWMPRAYHIVDAFADSPFSGNPAAVVFDADGLSDASMQLIAREFNIGATAFVLPPRDPAHTAWLRWFTPTVELHLCGHASLATVHALIEAGRVCTDDDGSVRLCDAPTAEHAGSGNCSGELRIETRSGVLVLRSNTADEHTPLIWLALPCPSWKPVQIPARALQTALGIEESMLVEGQPPVRTGDRDVILPIRDVPTLNDLRPNREALIELSQRADVRGWCVSTTRTLSGGADSHSRFFAPAYGLDEDPVSGSVHGPLAALLVDRGLVHAEGDVVVLRCVQAQPGGRAGLIHAAVQRDAGGYTVAVGGRAMTTMRGMLVQE
jgi:PhzF family phenazine biosynthesis protein